MGYCEEKLYITGFEKNSKLPIWDENASIRVIKLFLADCPQCERGGESEP